MYAKNMINKYINSFFVLDYKVEKRKSYLLVKCPICGAVKWMRADRVVKAKSCGCLSRQAQFKTKDIKGQKFGRLTVLEPTDKRAANGSAFWRCICACGNTVDVVESSLLRGISKSCGCLSREVHTESAKKRMLENVKTVCIEDTRLDNLVAKKPKNNTSGVKGVVWDKSRGKWIAQIVFKGKRHFLGRYETIEEAAKARTKAEEELFKPVLDKYNYKANNKID